MTRTNTHELDTRMKFMIYGLVLLPPIYWKFLFSMSGVITLKY